MKVALTGLARDVGIFLPHVLLIIDEIRNRCHALWPGGSFLTLFFENDSSDNTREILNAWSVQRDHVVLLTEEKLIERYPKRTHRLAHARNIVLGYLRSRHSDYDRVVIMDMDEVCTQLDVDGFFHYLTSNFNGVAVKCSNSQPRHSDPFALRGLLPPLKQCVTTADRGKPNWWTCNSLDKHGIDERFLCDDRRNFKGDDPVQVKSCFNHLAIYDGKILLQSHCTYDGTIGDKEECEHVPLNTCLSISHAVQVEPNFVVHGLAKEYVFHEGLDVPFSSRRLPHLTGIFSWNSEYLRYDTEETAPPGFFKEHWNPNAAWVWVRAHSPGHAPGEYDISQFAKDIVPLLTKPIVLLTGDGGLSIPAELPPDVSDTILKCPFIACWITQNCSSPGSYGGKLQAMPIGLDDKLNNSKVIEAPSPRPRSGRVVMDAHLINGKYSETAQKRWPNQLSRKQVFEAVKNLGHVTYPPRRIPRGHVHDLWKDTDFVVCCEGNGMDTHRAWEVLCMNRIPIVCKTPMTTSLFRGLPVILSEDIVKTVSDHKSLLEISRTFPTSSPTNLWTGLWLGRACGRGGMEIWVHSNMIVSCGKHASRMSWLLCIMGSWWMNILFLLLVGLCVFLLSR